MATMVTPILHRDYLRVCGADIDLGRTPRYRLGLPPRVRSRPRQLNRLNANSGITSACAEQTC